MWNDYIFLWNVICLQWQFMNASVSFLSKLTPRTWIWYAKQFEEWILWIYSSWLKTDFRLPNDEILNILFYTRTCSEIFIISYVDIMVNLSCRWNSRSYKKFKANRSSSDEIQTKLSLYITYSQNHSNPKISVFRTIGRDARFKTVELK